MRKYTLPMNKVSTDINILLAELESLGFSQLPDKCIPTFETTTVYVNLKGQVATIIENKEKGTYRLNYREIKPMDKGAGKSEYRVNIDGKTHAVHILVCYTYPSITGRYIKGVNECHHLSGNHLENNATNLKVLTPEVHQLVHLLSKDEVRKDEIKSYLSTTPAEDITIESLMEDLRYA